MFLILGLLALIPLVLFRDWMNSINRRDPRDQELTKAAHGAGMIVLAGIYFLIAGDWRTPFPKPTQTSIIILLIIAVCGAFWLVTGAARSRGYIDSRIAMRSGLKIGLGIGIFVFSDEIRDFIRPHLPYAFWGYAMWLGLAIIIWCIVTGGVKLGLNMRGLQEIEAGTDIEDMPHGDAGFGKGGGLRDQ